MDFSDFRKEYARKYRTPEEAVEVVKSGDWVDYTSNVGFPYLLVSISSIIPGTAAPMSASSVTGACATTSP